MDIKMNVEMNDTGVSRLALVIDGHGIELDIAALTSAAVSQGTSPEVAAPVKRGRGRPVGSKNKKTKEPKQRKTAKATVKPAIRNPRASTSKSKASLAEMIDEKILKVGEPVYFLWTGHEREAVIHSDGIDMDGVVYSNPSGAGVAIKGGTINGWSYWGVRRNRKIVPLITLRDKFVADRQP